MSATCPGDFLPGGISPAGCASADSPTSASLPRPAPPLRTQELDLSNNRLSYIPSALCTALVSLDFLDLNRNNLTRLPADINRLVRLKWLDVEGNRLGGLPSGMVNMKSLEVGTRREGTQSKLHGHRQRAVDPWCLAWSHSTALLNRIALR